MNVAEKLLTVSSKFNSSSAKQQATRELQSKFTNLLCKLQEFRAKFRIPQARIDEFGRGFPAAAKLILLNHAQNELYENSGWQLIPQFKTNFPIQMAEGSSFRMLAYPNDVTLPGAVIESREKLRGNFRTARSVSEFNFRRKSQLFHILMGQPQFHKPNRITSSRGSLGTDVRNVWYFYNTTKKAPVSAVYSETHPLIMSRLKAYDFQSMLDGRNNPQEMTMEEKLDIRDLNYLLEKNANCGLEISFTGIDPGN